MVHTGHPLRSPRDDVILSDVIGRPRFPADCREINGVAGSSDEVEPTRSHDEPDAEFQTEPGVADALRVEEGAVRFRRLALEHPAGQSLRRHPALLVTFPR